jgi:predicted Fe-Mo cluster-binding NifX family protein
MKIAIASNNGITIQRHFGRTRQYVVATIDDRQEVAREVRPIDVRYIHEQDHHRHHHGSLLEPIVDCEVLIANGMGAPMARHADASGVRLILTDERLVDDIVASFAAGTLQHHPELAHQPGH